MRIIALGHRSGVGKDTLGMFMFNMLKEFCPKCKIKKVAFAAKLKDMCYTLYKWAGVREAAFYEEHREQRTVLIPELNMDYIQLLVKVGNLIRDVHSETWIREALFQECDYLVITDLRYLNEAEAVKRIDPNCKRIKITNSRAPIRNTVADNALEGNETWYDKLIQNEGTKQDLYNTAKELVQWAISST